MALSSISSAAERFTVSIAMKIAREKSRELGFRLIQFNAVVKINHGAISLYESLGFVRLGTIPGGFLLKGGKFEDIVLFYREL